jgi:ficolin
MKLAHREALGLVAVWLVFGCYPALGNEFERGSYVRKLSSCRLAAFSRQNATATEARCKYVCLVSECAAYQWVNGSCQMQDVLDIKIGAGEQSVGVFVGDKPEVPVPCPARDCADILEADGSSQSGVYQIMPAGHLTSLNVWCDMDTDGGGWTVFLRRQDGSVDFYRDRAAYKAGFGAVGGEHWLGLEALHAITSAKTYQLRADVTDWAGAFAYSHHASMLVGDEASQYRLTLGAFLGGNGGDCLMVNNGLRFTTKDLDFDTYAANCGSKHYGAWWYGGCSACHPTAKYYHGGAYTAAVNNGIQWRTWSAHLDDSWYSVKTLQLKLRP